MAIFGSKKNKETTKDTKPAAAKAATKAKAPKAAKIPADKKAPKAKAAESTSADVVSVSHGAGAILRPRITEKSGYLSQSGVYTFEVSKDATKDSIGRAVTALYKVRPVKVAIINLPSRKVFIRGRRGEVAGVRKALVTLKKGDKIDFV